MLMMISSWYVNKFNGYTHVNYTLLDNDDIKLRVDYKWVRIKKMYLLLWYKVYCMNEHSYARKIQHNYSKVIMSYSIKKKNMYPGR